MFQLLSAAETAQAEAPKAVRVAPHVPILYFGRLSEYQKSDLRIVTVGLNPSVNEFPATSPLFRFPALTTYNAEQSNVARYGALQAAYEAYFDNDPYMRWFGNLERVLEGFSASFCKRMGRTALHTDILSPIATSPTWSRLKKSDQSQLLTFGVPLWHKLIDHLQPHLLVVSVARDHFNRISFPSYGTKLCRVVLGGKSRYPIVAQTIQLVSGQLTDVIYMTPAQLPFGFLSDIEKVQIAQTLRGQLTNW